MPASAGKENSIDNVSHNEGDTGTTSYTFTAPKTVSPALTATFHYATATSAAYTPSLHDALPISTLTFLAGDTSKTVTVLVNGDATFEANETFSVNLSNA